MLCNLISINSPHPSFLSFATASIRPLKHVMYKEEEEEEKILHTRLNVQKIEYEKMSISKQ